jgi:hypothetical protein
MYEEHIIQVTDADKILFQCLNVEQMDAYETIISTIDSPNGGVFLVDGPRCTEKMFLYRALLGTIQS